MDWFSGKSTGNLHNWCRLTMLSGRFSLKPSHWYLMGQGLAMSADLHHLLTSPRAHRSPNPKLATQRSYLCGIGWCGGIPNWPWKLTEWLIPDYWHISSLPVLFGDIYIYIYTYNDTYTILTNHFICPRAYLSIAFATSLRNISLTFAEVLVRSRWKCHGQLFRFSSYAQALQWWKTAVLNIEKPIESEYIDTCCHKQRWSSFVAVNFPLGIGIFCCQVG